MTLFVFANSLSIRKFDLAYPSSRHQLKLKDDKKQDFANPGSRSQPIPAQPLIVGAYEVFSGEKQKGDVSWLEVA